MGMRVAVRDQTGAPVKDAVVYATSKATKPSQGQEAATAALVVEKSAFKPAVLPVRVGTEVLFQNRDDLGHHIYSISAAKNFDLFATGLSVSGEVVFDRPGEVVLGCADQDRTIGYIYVLETPYFATTGADGTAELKSLPCEAYEVRVWHPGMKGAAATAQLVGAAPSQQVALVFAISLQSGGGPRGRAPVPGTMPPR